MMQARSQNAQTCLNAHTFNCMTVFASRIAKHSILLLPFPIVPLNRTTHFYSPAHMCTTSRRSLDVTQQQQQKTKSERDC